MILSTFADHSHEVHAVHVTTQREEQCLPEAEQTRVTPKQINRHRQKRVAEIFSPKADRKAAHPAQGMEERKKKDKENRSDTQKHQFDVPTV